ncbi:GSU2403 family nucleotidyltransferase fold protein [Amaricoccus tamworthensis]|uniref:GSU2403 family nucleotidyltransferase fold protein n=1 Tax=Amaricoccus tamworthensis TaxID=57002 RepID=UPI003C79BF1F
MAIVSSPWAFARLPISILSSLSELCLPDIPSSCCRSPDTGFSRASNGHLSRRAEMRVWMHPIEKKSATGNKTVCQTSIFVFGSGVYVIRDNTFRISQKSQMDIPVRIPAPERFAVHKLIVAPARRGTCRSRSGKDLA